MISKKAYAKINVALEVMDTVNGYHLVNNIMLPIDIYDELSFEKNDDIFVVDDIFPGENIIVKAAKLFFEYTKINGGVKVVLNKMIPHAAGLAGGSTDAATTLLALNELYDTKLSDNELIELSAKLGSDVGFFIQNKPALCTGRGEIINPLESKLSKVKLLLIKPNEGLSTALVYKNYIYKNEDKSNIINAIKEALKNDDVQLLNDNIFNDLGPVALSLNGEMKYIYDLLKNNGLNPLVSGSGPTMYLFNTNDSDIKKAYELLKNQSVFIKECMTK